MSLLNTKLSTSVPIPVLYGSQTGTAQDTAGHVARVLMRHYLSATAVAMDSFQLAKLLDVRFAIFIVATTGQGEEPDNMKKTWRFLLRKSLPSNSLEKFQFAVFGLGDSSYPKYNFVAKKLHKRLQLLGGRSIVPIGLADDQHPLGVDGALSPWIDALMENLRDIFPSLINCKPLPISTLLPPVVSIELLDDDQSLSIESGCRPYNNETPSRSAPAKVLLKENTRLTPQHHFQDVRYVDFYVSCVSFCLSTLHSPKFYKSKFKTLRLIRIYCLPLT